MSNILSNYICIGLLARTRQIMLNADAKGIRGPRRSESSRSIFRIDASRRVTLRDRVRSACVRIQFPRRAV